MIQKKKKKKEENKEEKKEEKNIEKKEEKKEKKKIQVKDEEERNEKKKDEIISLLQLNCFLVPSFLPNAKQSGCTDHFVRAQEIGKLASQYDLIGLQEMWGSNVDEVEKALRSTHGIRNDNASWSLPGSWFQNVINPAKYWWTSTGGLWFAQHLSLPIVHEARIRYGTSCTKSGKGAQLTVVDVSSRWSSITRLAIFNTHLDPRNVNHSQEIQIAELSNFIQHQVEVLLSVRPYDSSQLAVVILGDFNISPKQELYKSLRTLGGYIHEGRDLHLEYITKLNLKEQATYGDARHGRRIDYIFTIDSINKNIKDQIIKNEEERSEFIKLGKLKCLRCEVLHDLPGLRISDHFPTSVVFIPA